VLPVIEQFDDVGMAEGGDGSCFALEALLKIGLTGNVGTDDFNSDITVNGGLASAIDRRHTACAQDFEDAILIAENLPD
jgi:hypothetical protein